MSGPLPEFVYLITVEGEWAVSAIADDHPTTPQRIANEVKRRTTGQTADRAHVWRIKVAPAVELELVPASVVPAQLRVRTP